MMTEIPAHRLVPLYLVLGSMEKETIGPRSWDCYKKTFDKVEAEDCYARFLETGKWAVVLTEVQVPERIEGPKLLDLKTRSTTSGLWWTTSPLGILTVSVEENRDAFTDVALNAYADVVNSGLLENYVLFALRPSGEQVMIVYDGCDDAPAPYTLSFEWDVTHPLFFSDALSVICYARVELGARGWGAMLCADLLN